MSKIVFPTQWSESVKIGTFETNLKPDMCEPDNAMSIPEIIARFTRGQGLAVQAKPWETGSAFEPDGSRPDDSDLDSFMEIPKDPVIDPAPAPAPVPAPAPAPVPAPAPPQKTVISGGPGMSALVVDAPAQ